jgi:transcription elongation factor
MNSIANALRALREAMDRIVEAFRATLTALAEALAPIVKAWARAARDAAVHVGDTGTRRPAWQTPYGPSTPVRLR